MTALTAWLSVPSHYTPILLILYSLIEYVIGKSGKVKPNSLLDLVLHVVTGRIGQVLIKQGVVVPHTPAPSDPPADSPSAG